MAMGHVFQLFFLQPLETEMYFLCIKVTFPSSPTNLADAALEAIPNIENPVQN